MFCVPSCPIPIKDIISDTGYVRGCFDEEIEGILVQDKLREMFANPETENSEVFTMAQKEEFYEYSCSSTLYWYSSKRVL